MYASNAKKYGVRGEDQESAASEETRQRGNPAKIQGKRDHEKLEGSCRRRATSTAQAHIACSQLHQPRAEKPPRRHHQVLITRPKPKDAMYHIPTKNTAHSSFNSCGCPPGTVGSLDRLNHKRLCDHSVRPLGLACVTTRSDRSVFRCSSASSRCRSTAGPLGPFVFVRFFEAIRHRPDRRFRLGSNRSLSTWYLYSLMSVSCKTRVSM